MKYLLIFLVFVLFILFIIGVIIKFNETQFSIKITNYSSSKQININSYKVKIDAKQILEIENNLSGITYNPKTDTLFAITNRPRKIYELTKEAEVIREIELKSFKDTEGITFVENDLFAVVDEKKNLFSIFNIDKDTKSIDLDEIKDKFILNIKSYKNMGYEGITYDINKKEFYIVNEKFPMQIIKVKNWLKCENINISFENFDMENILDDFSGSYFDSKYNHLLILSDESKMVIEINLDDKKISFGNLKKGQLGLKEDIPQAEGITMDNNRNIYIVSEPNLFYKFEKKDLF